MAENRVCPKILFNRNLRLDKHDLSLSIFRDIAKYNTDDDLEESMEETGWKLVHGDVFRTPNNNRLFASIIGSGVQIFCMMAITIFFAMLGMPFDFVRILSVSFYRAHFKYLFVQRRQFFTLILKC